MKQFYSLKLHFPVYCYINSTGLHKGGLVSSICKKGWWLGTGDLQLPGWHGEVSYSVIGWGAYKGNMSMDAKVLLSTPQNGYHKKE